MIKTVLTVAIPLGLGVALGAGATLWEFKTSGDHFLAFRQPQKVIAGSNEEDLHRGTLTVLNDASHDFGVMDQFATGQHTFKIKNEGDGPLSITLLQTSCKCTSSDLAEGEPVTLSPDEIKDITLQWEAKEYSRSFSQSATFRTSDPKNQVLQLTVEGRIDSLLNVSPESIVFADFRSKVAKTRSLRVYSYKHEHLQCEQVQQLKPELETYFDIEVSPLDVDEIAEVKDVKSGLLVNVTAKPGIPLGSFRQRVSLTTNVDVRTPVEFEIEGNVVGDISIFSREKYNQRKQVLDLGLIKRGTRKKAELQIFVKGEHRDTKVTLDPSSVEPPDVMKATLGSPVAMGKKARRFPLIVEVAAGDRTISRLARVDDDNYGKIVLKTTHPDAPEIVIRVAFATGG